MSAERTTPQDETVEQEQNDFRGKRRDWRRWWEKAEAWDPERRKAMAMAWASTLQDRCEGANGNMHATDLATKTCPYCAEEIKVAAIKCKHCGTWLACPPEPLAGAFNPGFGDIGHTARAKGHQQARLTRSTQDSMVFGVLGGLGRFVGLDPTWLRIGFALGTLFTAVIPGIVAYAVLALIIPNDGPDHVQGLE